MQRLFHVFLDQVSVYLDNDNSYYYIYSIKGDLRNTQIFHSKTEKCITESSEKGNGSSSKNIYLQEMLLMSITIQESNHQRNQFGTARYILILFSLMQKSV